MSVYSEKGLRGNLSVSSRKASHYIKQILFIKKSIDIFPIPDSLLNKQTKNIRDLNI